MTVDKGNLLYEGKAKKVFLSSKPQELIQEFKDSLTAFNAQKKGSFKGKGALNLKITTAIFGYLKSQGIDTHFIKQLDGDHMLVQKLEIIPLEVVVRNRAAGSMSQRLGITEGTSLKHAIVEFYYKKDELNDPIVTVDHVVDVLGVATKGECETLRASALKINEKLQSFFKEIGVDLIDFKIEFGKDENGKILLGDEISPDSCRLWDSQTSEKLDKDRFRRDLGKVEESYQLISDKILKRWGAK